MNLDKLKFNVEIKNVEEINPLFSRCRVYICYSDLNRNNSDISKELINQKLNTLLGCPIVGQYGKEKDDFTDHGGVIEVTDNGDLNYVVTTIPYGFVPESSEIAWETVDGKEYITCTGFLWTSRYPESLKVIEEGRPQSMELEQVKGEWNDKKQFVISDFVFSALCILGNDVEPCYEGAKITAYSLNTEQFEQEFKEMVKQLTKSLKDTQLSVFSITKTVKKEGEIVKSKKEIAAQFSLTANQLYDELSRALGELTYETTNWYGEQVEVSRFYMRDYDDQFAYAVDRQNDYIDVKIPYTKSGDNVTFDLENVGRIKYTPTDWEGSEPSDDDEMPVQNFSLHLIEEVKQVFKTQKESYSKKLSENHDSILSLTEQFNETKAELESLRQFKKDAESSQRKENVDSVFSRFAKHLNKEEIDAFRAKEPTFTSFEDFEKEIKSFVCDKVVEDVKKEPTTYSRMGIPPQDPNITEPSNVWDRLSEKNK